MMEFLVFISYESKGGVGEFLEGGIYGLFFFFFSTLSQTEKGGKGRGSLENNIYDRVNEVEGHG